ncbi:hypothetical protein GGI43DRAFT_383649 [Trichoderma evansii]
MSISTRSIQRSYQLLRMFLAQQIINSDIVYAYATNEFIFLYRIPNASLKRKWSLEEIKENVEEIEVQKVEAEAEEEDRRYAARRSNPHYHYVPELSGWYDDDEECEERDAADDMINMMEGDCGSIPNQSNPAIKSDMEFTPIVTSLCHALNGLGMPGDAVEDMAQFMGQKIST